MTFYRLCIHTLTRTFKACNPLCNILSLSLSLSLFIANEHCSFASGTATIAGLQGSEREGTSVACEEMGKREKHELRVGESEFAFACTSHFVEREKSGVREREREMESREFGVDPHSLL